LWIGHPGGREAVSDVVVQRHLDVGELLVVFGDGGGEVEIGQGEEIVSSAEVPVGGADGEGVAVEIALGERRGARAEVLGWLPHSGGGHRADEMDAGAAVLGHPDEDLFGERQSDQGGDVGNAVDLGLIEADLVGHALELEGVGVSVGGVLNGRTAGGDQQKEQ